MMCTEGQAKVISPQFVSPYWTGTSIEVKSLLEYPVRNGEDNEAEDERSAPEPRGFNEKERGKRS